MIGVATKYHNELFAQYTKLIDDKLFWAFTIVVLIDLILDLIKPWYTDDKIGWFSPHSVLRNAVTYAVVAIGYPYLFTIGANTAATAFLLAFIYQYLVWIVETWTSIGWWLPAPLVHFVKSKWLTHNNDLENSLNKKKDENKDENSLNKKKDENKDENKDG